MSEFTPPQSSNQINGQIVGVLLERAERYAAEIGKRAPMMLAEVSALADALLDDNRLAEANDLIDQLSAAESEMGYAELRWQVTSVAHDRLAAREREWQQRLADGGDA